MDGGTLRIKSPQIHHHAFPPLAEMLLSPLVHRQAGAAQQTRLKTFSDNETVGSSRRGQALDAGDDRESDNAARGEEGGRGSDWGLRAGPAMDQTLRLSSAQPPRADITASTMFSPPSLGPQTRSPDLKQPQVFDSAYSSLQSSLHHTPSYQPDLEARTLIVRARERVEIYRGRVLRTRHLLSQSLLNVQELRAAFQDATDGLMRAVDVLIICDDGLRAQQRKGLEELKVWQERLRQAKNELGPAEWAIEDLFHRLNFEEGELEEEEENFYARNGAELATWAADEGVGSTSDTPVHENLEQEARGEKRNDIEEEDESVDRFLEKKGNAEHLKEKLDEMESQYYDLKEEQAFRTRHALPFDGEKEAFIIKFAEVHQAATSELEAVEDELYDLRQYCIETGLFTPSDYLYEPHDALIEDLWAVVDDIHDRSPMREVVSRHPEQLSRKAECRNQREFVNTWLWGWIQDNAVERWRLRGSILEGTTTDEGEEPPAVMEDRWAELALRLWYQDDAGSAMERGLALSTIDAFLAESDGTGGASECTSLLIDLGERPILGFDAPEKSQLTMRPLSGAAPT